MPLRVYIDTSVIGGCMDEEFAEESRSLIEMARFAKLILLVSDLLLDELSRAPSEVQSLFKALPAATTELLETSEEALQLRDAYLAANVLGPSGESDAQHVAIATVAKADVIVSWNFKHIVHVDKIRLFNAVNLAHGYRLIDIRSPLEVV